MNFPGSKVVPHTILSRVKRITERTKRLVKPTCHQGQVGICCSPNLIINLLEAKKCRSREFLVNTGWNTMGCGI